MQFKPNYIVIPMIVFFLGISENYIVGRSFYPEFNFFSIIFFLVSVLPILLFWNKFPHNRYFNIILWLFIGAGLLRLLHAYIFVTYQRGESAIVLFTLLPALAHIVIITIIMIALWLNKIRIAAALLLFYLIVYGCCYDTQLPNQDTIISNWV
jgi:tryptophan-rich sensory protein